ncbi:MAG: sugar ABC transporter permease [Spirochaetaceae bacterium]|nr:sugar ABC transporter permease [Spirochaetaceae bacterium]MBR3813178.1 sugar ABC transporter permease [Spirochaetaceae bacterium]MDD6486112.1 sugar ABC transporter permease [Spirochaetales bacterium]
MLDKKKQNFWIAMAFLIVPLVIFTFFVVLPVFKAAVYGLFRWNGMGPLTGPEAGRKTQFVGLENFKEILTDPIFWKSFGHNVKIIVLSVLIELPIALILALIISTKSKSNIALRTVFFIPYVVSEVIAGVVWTFIYSPQYGISTTFLAALFPAGTDFAFLGKPETVFNAIFIVVIWKYFGLYMILYIAGLQGISDDIREAAAIDGASPLQLNMFIIIPLLLPTIVVTLFFCIVGSLQTFDIIWAMGKGDPVNSAETMVTYLYKFGFRRSQMGYGSAIAIVIFVICVTFNAVYQKLIKTGE